MLNSLFIFIVAMAMVIYGATLATKYSAKLAEDFKLSKYIIGFIVVAFISILPEALISINSAFAGVPSLGLGTLFGSNVADLTLVFAIIIIFTGKEIKLESKILSNVNGYPFFLILPLFLGLNGYYSRLEGLLLIIVGGFFYYMVFKNDVNVSVSLEGGGKNKYKNILMLILSMALLLVGSSFTVSSAVSIAGILSISPILIGMLIVGLGTTMPELFFSLKSVQKGEDDLAVGDILGTVLADATILVGVLAFIHPFYFPVKIIYITGIFMLVASIILLTFMYTGQRISKKEGYLLLVFWIIYVLTETIISG
ncbi:MAG: hypothetical protein WC933_02110 [Candidatus Paceibacterota bacterium]|jgi:cation:H+ antiporter